MKFIDNLTYIEAPDDYALKVGERSVFLAGGITGCPDWQSSMVEKLREKGGKMAVFNPRRSNFDVKDPTAAEKQIAWEFKALRSAELISFWFAEDQIQPIALFEYGAWMSHSWSFKGQCVELEGQGNVVVGCHPKYPRRQDVIIQTRLARPDIIVVDNLDALASLVHAKLA
jgi:hypothetical protein